ncbi:MAG: 50S ribosomal protein L25 [Myxococcales bacterium]|nr:50S ribosomal protein L25 [Myxococcales bacterium]
MDTQTLQAEVRAERGKGPARRLRAQGKIPAVVYGPGAEPTPLTVDPKDVEKHLRGAFGRNTLFSLAFEGKEELAVVRDVTVEPATRELLHVDFYRVSLDRDVEVQVPIRTTGRALGQVKGGAVNVARRTVSVRCRPNLVPAEIVIDVTEVDLNGTVQVKDLSLPEGVVVTLKPELSLVTVVEDKRAARLAAKEAKEAEKAGKK